MRKGTVALKVVNRGAFTHDFEIAGKQSASPARGKTQTLSVVL